MTLAHVNGNNEKVFFPTKQHSKFEKNATDDYGQYYEESKNKNMFDPDNYPKNPRFSCKSVQNSNFKTSPIKESTKTEQRFSSYAQAYVPSYANGSPVKQQESANIRYDQPSWQQPEIKENSAYANLFENSCFQLLNEKLTAFTTGRFKRPQYKPRYYYDPDSIHANSKARSVPTGVPHSENSYGGHYYDNSESSDIDQYQDDGAFYERLDEDIYQYVHEVNRSLQSVAEEREVLVKKIIVDI